MFVPGGDTREPFLCRQFQRFWPQLVFTPDLSRAVAWRPEVFSFRPLRDGSGRRGGLR